MVHEANVQKRTVQLAVRKVLPHRASTKGQTVSHTMQAGSMQVVDEVCAAVQTPSVRHLLLHCRWTRVRGHSLGIQRIPGGEGAFRGGWGLAGEVFKHCKVRWLYLEVQGR